MKNDVGGVRVKTVEYSRSPTDERINVQLPVSSQSDQTLQLGNQRLASETNSLVTIILGRNGLGKSRVLGGIASMFSLLGPDSRIRSSTGIRNRHRDPRWRIKYEIDGKEHTLAGESGKMIHPYRQNNLKDASNAPRPKKVIALSSTVSDKFPLPYVGREYAEPSARSYYVYMGLRDRTGRASGFVRLRQLLEMLLGSDLDDELRTAQVESVFNFLGYRPNVDAFLRWRVNFEGSLEDFIGEDEPRPTYTGISRSRLKKIKEEDPDNFKRLNRSAENVHRYFGHKSFNYPYRIGASALQAKSDLENDLAALIREGIVRVESMELERISDGVKIELQELSSGELSLVATLLGLALTIEHNSLILIDEPELSLHPEWQENYLDLLFRVCAKYKGCHTIIATHSPLVVSNIPKQGTEVISLESGSQIAGPLAGSSTDEILLRAFGAPGNSNLYLKKLLVEALRLAADGEISTERFDRIIGTLEAVRTHLDSGDPSLEVIQGLEEIQRMEIQ